MILTIDLVPGAQVQSDAHWVHLRGRWDPHVRKNILFSSFCAIRKSCDQYCSTSFLRVRNLQGHQSAILDAAMALKNNESQKGKALTMEEAVCLVRNSREHVLFFLPWLL